MAVNTLTEIYARDSLEQAMINESVRKSAVWNSGMVTIDPALAKMVGDGEGRKINRVGYNDQADPLATGNAAQATTHNPGYPDDSATTLISNASSTYMYDAVKTVVAYSLGQKEIIKACSFLPDPVSALNNRMTNYWARYFDMYAVSILKGIYADNKANDSSDMIAGDGSGPITADLILDGFATLGDAANLGGSILIVNSAVAFVLRKAQLIDAIPSAENSAVMFEYFQGNRMIVSNQGPTDTTCVSILAEPGTMEIGQSANDIVSSETYRDPTVGVGGGEEQLITREQFAMHCMGFTWEDDTVSGSVSSGAIPGLSNGTKLWPCPADMALAANWDRVLDRKSVKISFLHTSETPAT